jgi:hypothetical protein
LALLVKLCVLSIISIFETTASTFSDTGRYEHITPALRDILHWLPVQQRISSIARLQLHPWYWSWLLQWRLHTVGIPGHANLRAADSGDFLVPSTKTKIGSQSFRIAAPTVWNSPSSARPNDQRTAISIEIENPLVDIAYE